MFTFRNMTQGFIVISYFTVFKATYPHVVLKKVWEGNEETLASKVNYVLNMRIIKM